MLPKLMGSFVLPLALLINMAVAYAQAPEKRIALVIGNAAYERGALPTTANDAGLIAQTLQAAGFDVTGARDLDSDALRHTFHDFVEKAATTGPNTVVFVYLAGYGLQLTGENYFAPINARIARDVDVPVEAVRVSDYLRQLNALSLKGRVIVFDGARSNPFTLTDQPLAGGLALMEAEANSLIAFNAAPGTVGPAESGSYGAYAQALSETIREGGLPLPEMFDRLRLRVNDMTKGAELPWDSQKLDQQITLFERTKDAPPIADPVKVSALRSKSIKDLGAQDAYAAALSRDTLQGYQDYTAAYPNDPMAERVRAILAARREALTWRRTYVIDTPAAYWSYLQRYPVGPHAYDARRRLAFFRAAFAPPPAFAYVDYDVPPPPPAEIVYVRRPVLFFGDPIFTFAPPPPPPAYFLPPFAFVALPPPPPPTIAFLLPAPMFVAFPAFISPPVYVAPPPNNIIFSNIHNTTVINNVINQPAATGPAGATANPSASALPPFVAQRAGLTTAGQPSASSGTNTATPSAVPARAPAQALPGTNGQPLPAVASRPAAATTPATTTQAPLSVTSTPGNQTPTGAKPATANATTGRGSTGPNAQATTQPNGTSPISPSKANVTAPSANKPAAAPDQTSRPLSAAEPRAAKSSVATPVSPGPANSGGGQIKSPPTNRPVQPAAAKPTAPPPVQACPGSACPEARCRKAALAPKASGQAFMRPTALSLKEKSAGFGGPAFHAGGSPTATATPSPARRAPMDARLIEAVQLRLIAGQLRSCHERRTNPASLRPVRRHRPSRRLRMRGGPRPGPPHAAAGR